MYNQDINLNSSLLRKTVVAAPPVPHPFPLLPSRSLQLSLLSNLSSLLLIRVPSRLPLRPPPQGPSSQVRRTKNMHLTGSETFNIMR